MANLTRWGGMMTEHLSIYTDVLNLLTSWADHGFFTPANELTTLAALDPSRLAVAMQAILAQADLATRFAAMDALRFVAPDDVVAELLLPYLCDPNSNVRWTICDLLFRNTDLRVIQPLVGVLLEDPDANVRLMATETLLMIGDSRALPALEYAAAHDLGKDYEDRSIAARAREAILAIRAREQPRS